MRPPSWFKGALLLRGGEGKGRKGVGEGRVGSWTGRKVETPPPSIPAYAPGRSFQLVGVRRS